MPKKYFWLPALLLLTIMAFITSSAFGSGVTYPRTAVGTMANPGPAPQPANPLATPTSCATSLSIIIVYADSTVTNLRTALLAQPGVQSVDLFDARANTPTLAQLVGHNQVIAFSDYSFANKVALGNVLADYQDQGGVVVGLNFDWSSGVGLGGRWIDQAYSPFLIPSQDYFGNATLGTYNPGDPLMQGVTTLSAYYRTQLFLDPNAELHASWSDSLPLLAVKGRAAGINAYLGDTNNSWSGDFGRLLVNLGRDLGGLCPYTTPTPVGGPTVTNTPCPGLGAAASPQTIGLDHPGQAALIRNQQGGATFKRKPVTSRPAHPLTRPDQNINFVLDDGEPESAIGFSGQQSYAAIWLNRFSPTPIDYPIHLRQISILFPDPTAAGQDLTGFRVDLLVYLDADHNNDPSNAVKLAQIPVTITIADGLTFSNYAVDVTAQGPGDLYLGFSDTYNSGGRSPITDPTNIDETFSRERSWTAAMSSGANPNYDNLGANDLLGTIDSFGIAGNWLIRASGDSQFHPCGQSTTQTPTPLVTSTAIVTPGQATTTPMPTVTITAPPSATNTPSGPTNTPAPTNTPGGPTNTPLPTNTPGRPSDTPLPTNTPRGPTNTPQPFATAPPTDCPNPFVDVAGNIFYLAIHYLNCRGVINGTDATHYSPAGTATRGQFAKVVVLGFGIAFYTPGTPDFSDVPPSYFAYVYIETGFHNGVLSGFDQNSCIAHGVSFPCYLPNIAITRGQLTKLVVNAAHYPLYTPTSGQTFSDVPASNVFFVSIETAHAHNVINGYPDGTFRPNNPIRRDEMAQIVYKAVTTP